MKKYEVIEFYDVYRKDLLDDYGAKEYYHHALGYDTTTETKLADFKTEKEAMEFAKERFLKIPIKETANISGNNIYLLRIDVVSCKNENSLENIWSFGMSLEMYEIISGKYNIELLKKLYDYMNRDIDNVPNDIKYNYLTINIGTDEQDYYYYRNESKSVLIDMEGNIITNQNEIQKIINYEEVVDTEDEIDM